MKSFKLLLIVLILILISTNNSFSQPAKTEKKSIFKLLKIDSSDKLKIENELTKNKGVFIVTASTDDKRVTIVYDPTKITEEDLKKNIEKMGYKSEIVVDRQVYSKPIDPNSR